MYKRIYSLWSFLRLPAQRALWTTCLGNFFEHYDTALFGLLSPVLAPLIFPKQDPLTALIFTYAIIPLGMIARPLGALVFGYMGDVYGRRQALFLALTGMGCVSGGFALMPTYMQVGVLAPILFCVGRALQNFLSGGETMGGAIFLLEQAPPKRHDWLSGLYNASTMGGHVLASFGVYILSCCSAMDAGWRLLYVFGCITALFGALLRRQGSCAASSATFSGSLSRWGGVLWTYRKTVLLIALSSGFSYANYAMILVLMNGLLPFISTITLSEVMEVNSYMLVLDFCALPVFGWLASKVSREKLMLVAALSIAVCAIPLCALLEGVSFMGMIGIRAGLVLLGVAFSAPFHAWVQHLVPAEHRYAVISLGYALGSQMIGGPTAALALWCFQKTGIVSSVSWYWVVLALVSSGIVAFSVRLMGKTGRSWSER